METTSTCNEIDDPNLDHQYYKELTLTLVSGYNVNWQELELQQQQPKSKYNLAFIERAQESIS